MVIIPNLLIGAGFSNSSYTGEISSPVENSYLPTFSDDKAETLAVCLSKLYLTLFCSILSFFSHWQSFYNKFFLNLNGLSYGKVVSFTKKEMGL